MKKRKSIILILLVIFNIISNNSLAEDLSKLPSNDRNKRLIEIAKKVYKTPQVKNYYREFGTPAITGMKTRTLPADERRKIAENSKSIWYGSSNNQKFYIVYFFYDMDKERFKENYAANVYIWENTGEAFAIGLGNMMMLPVKNGKVPECDNQENQIKYYNITYSKNTPNFDLLPKKGKYGDIITIELKTITSKAHDGWITEHGYNFDPNSDLTNGLVISNIIKKDSNNESRILKLMVTGDMKINVTNYIEEYESPY